MKIVSAAEQYLYTRHKIQASRLLGSLRNVSGHIWVRIICCSRFPILKYFLALAQEVSG